MKKGTIVEDEGEAYPVDDTSEPQPSRAPESRGIIAHRDTNTGKHDDLQSLNEGFAPATTVVAASAADEGGAASVPDKGEVDSI